MSGQAFFFAGLGVGLGIVALVVKDPLFMEFAKVLVGVAIAGAIPRRT